MKKFLIVLIMLLIYCYPTTLPATLAAEEDGIIYQIYDEYGFALTQRQGVEVGDKFIDSGLNEYEIYLVDEANNTAKAKFIQTYEKPKVTKKTVEKISTTPKKIALYMTHNDESYLIGDGTSSVYGAGGIHDIAKTLKSSLESYGIDVTLDETLHIPHDSKAYTRSNVTAVKLIKEKPDAIFDIHRDGASRSTYVTTANGKEHSKVRIVLGQSNANNQENLQFALYLMSVAEVECPWLFHDIYWGKGHYNQALSNKAILFEMGTYTIEKDYVQETAKELARVINATLYKTTVSENNDLTINGTSTSEPTVNEALENKSSFKAVVIIVPSLIGAAAIATSLVIYNKKAPSKTTRRKK